MVDCEWTLLDYKSQSAEEAHYVKFLDRHVIDQKRAKEKIAAKLAAYKHGLNEKDKPAGILFFPGPSGVGKTFLVRVFAKLLIGNINAFTRIDCSNLQESHTISRLLGSPPGYVGYNDEPEFAQEKLNRPWKENHPDQISKEDKDKLDKMNLAVFEAKLILEELEKELLDLIEAEEEIEEKILELSTKRDDKEKAEAEKKRLEAEKKKNKTDQDKQVDKIKAAKINYSLRDQDVQRFVKQKQEEWSKKPCPSILLLDEIEKIHPSITRVLLSIFDTGETKLQNGDKVDFRNCFIFMTSNIGSKKIAETLSGKGPIGFTSDSQKKQKEIDLGTFMYETVMAEIMKSDHFPTELVGRIGKENIIVFHPLSDTGIKSIINIQLAELQKKVISASPKTKIIFSQGLKDFLFEETQDPLNKALGARPIESVIRAKLLEPLLNLIIKGSEDGGISPGDMVKIDVEEKDGKKKISIYKARNKNGVDIIG